MRPTDNDIKELAKLYTWLIQEHKKQNPDLYKKKEYN